MLNSRLVFYTMLIISLIIGCKSILYPDYIRDEFNIFYNRNQNLSSLININGYYTLHEKQTGLVLSIYFDESGIFNYQTFLDKSDTIDSKYYSVYCGKYKTSGDTIHTIFMSHPTVNGGFTAYKMDFLVINRTMLKVLCKRAIHESSRNKECVGEEKFSKAIFTPLEKLPPPRCWLLEEEWFLLNLMLITGGIIHTTYITK